MIEEVRTKEVSGMNEILAHDSNNEQDVNQKWGNDETAETYFNSNREGNIRLK